MFLQNVMMSLWGWPLTVWTCHHFYYPFRHLCHKKSRWNFQWWPKMCFVFCIVSSVHSQWTADVSGEEAVSPISTEEAGTLQELSSHSAGPIQVFWGDVTLSTNAPLLFAVKRRTNGPQPHYITAKVPAVKRSNFQIPWKLGNQPIKILYFTKAGFNGMAASV